MSDEENTKSTDGMEGLPNLWVHSRRPLPAGQGEVARYVVDPRQAAQFVEWLDRRYAPPVVSDGGPAKVAELHDELYLARKSRDEYRNCLEAINGWLVRDGHIPRPVNLIHVTGPVHTLSTEVAGLRRQLTDADRHAQEVRADRDTAKGLLDAYRPVVSAAKAWLDADGKGAGPIIAVQDLKAALRTLARKEGAAEVPVQWRKVGDLHGGGAMYAADPPAPGMADVHVVAPASGQPEPDRPVTTVTIPAQAALHALDALQRMDALEDDDARGKAYEAAWTAINDAVNAQDALPVVSGGIPVQDESPEALKAAIRALRIELATVRESARQAASLRATVERQRDEAVVERDRWRKRAKRQRRRADETAVRLKAAHEDFDELSENLVASRAVVRALQLKLRDAPASPLEGPWSDADAPPVVSPTPDAPGAVEGL